MQCSLRTLAQGRLSSQLLIGTAGTLRPCCRSYSCMLEGTCPPDRTPNLVAHLMKLPVSPGKPSAIASCSLPDTMRPSLWLLSMRSVSLCTARWRARRGQLPQMQGGLLVYTLASKMAILLTEACTAARVPVTDMTVGLHTRQGTCKGHTLCRQAALLHMVTSQSVMLECTS